MSTDDNLIRCIMNLRKADMQENSRLFGSIFPVSWNKERMANALAEIYKENTEKFLSMLNIRAIFFLCLVFEKDLNEKHITFDMNDYENHLFKDAYNQLEYLGLIDYFFGKITIPEILRSVVMCDLSSMEERFNKEYTMELCANGIIDAYGFIEDSIYTGMFRDCYPELSEDEAKSFLNRRISLLSWCNFFDTGDELWRFSPFIHNPDDWYVKLALRDDILYKRYTRKEFIEIACSGFAKKPKNYNELMNILINNGFSSDEAKSALLETIIIHCSQLDIQSYIPDFIMEFYPDNIDDAQRVIDLYVDFINDSPIWLNKGHTPREVLEQANMKSASKIKPGFKNPYPEIPVIDNESYLRQDNVIRFPVEKVQQKIERNAPCPCGSGKKYKNCCGRTRED